MIYYKAVWAFLPFGFERKNGMIVLGIDPGYAIVGYGVVEMKNNRYRTLEHGAVTTKAGTDFNRRLEMYSRRTMWPGPFGATMNTG